MHGVVLYVCTSIRDFQFNFRLVALIRDTLIDGARAFPICKRLEKVQRKVQVRWSVTVERTVGYRASTVKHLVGGDSDPMRHPVDTLQHVLPLVPHVLLSLRPTTPLGRIRLVTVALPLAQVLAECSVLCRPYEICQYGTSSLRREAGRGMSPPFAWSARARTSSRCHSPLTSHDQANVTSA